MLDNEGGITRKDRFLYGYFQFLDHFIGRKNTFKLYRNTRKRLYDNLQVQLKKKGRGEIKHVKREKNLSKEGFVESYLKKGIPVILEGAAMDWECVKKWSLDYFKDLHGEDEIIISGDNAREKPFEILKLKDLINNIDKGGDKYYRFYPLLSKHPEHIKDFNYNWLRERKAKASLGEFFQVFIGGKGTSTPMHNSTGGNLFTQVYGEKKFILYPPNQTIIIDPDPGKNLHRAAPYKTKAGPFDPFNPDYNYPYHLYEYIDSYEAHLTPGDVLFNPPHYWHAVSNLTNSIGVGYRWWAPVNSMKVSFLYSVLDIFIRKPTIFGLRKMYNKDYNILHIIETGNIDAYKKERKQ
jgi:lysine-specific demethylase 8